MELPGARKSAAAGGSGDRAVSGAGSKKPPVKTAEPPKSSAQPKKSQAGPSKVASAGKPRFKQDTFEPSAFTVKQWYFPCPVYSQHLAQ